MNGSPNGKRKAADSPSISADEDNPPIRNIRRRSATLTVPKQRSAESEQLPTATNWKIFFKIPFPLASGEAGGDNNNNQSFTRQATLILYNIKGRNKRHVVTELSQTPLELPEDSSLADFIRAAAPEVHRATVVFAFLEGWNEHQARREHLRLCLQSIIPIFRTCEVEIATAKAPSHDFEATNSIVADDYQMIRDVECTNAEMAKLVERELGGEVVITDSGRDLFDSPINLSVLSWKPGTRRH